MSLTGDFSATYDPGTLGVYITKVQGTGNLAQDYPADILSASASQIDIAAPPRAEQGTFDLYASALNGATPVNSNPMAFTYGPLVTTYDLDGAGNRLEVERAGETEGYTLGAPPGPADADVNQYPPTADLRHLTPGVATGRASTTKTAI